jgi:hypothetical protein
MADQNDKGFALPTPSDSAPASAPAPADSATAQVQSSLQQVVQGTANSSSRDLLIAGGAIMVFAIAFFFAKNFYANLLVGSKVPPRKANAAGWWLFILLLSLATVGILAAVNHARLLTLFYVLPLCLVAAVSLILMLVSSRR